MTGGGRERIAALAALDVLDTPAEPAFDDFAAIAATACATPIALVSLVDTERQWFKARVGLGIRETPIEQSICSIDLTGGALLEIPDLTADPRTRTNSLVTGPRAFRFYAGAPIATPDGTVVGRLCVIDTVPRPSGLDDAQRTILAALARRVGEQLDLRRDVRLNSRLATLQGALIEIAEHVRQASSVAAMTAAAAAVVGAALHVDRAGFGIVDDATEIVDIQPDWTAPGVVGIAGRHRFDDFGRLRDGLAQGEPLVIDDVATDPRTRDHVEPLHALSIGALVNVPVRENGRTTAVLIVHSTAARTWTTDELAFLRAVADRLEAGVTRHRLDKQQQALNGEISHRLKNTLSMVQAIASQTLRSVTDREPIDSFERRLIALGAAHDVLMEKNWREADVGSIVAGCLYAIGFGDRIIASGASVPLGARAALSLSLVVHELATNAAKYGALSSAGGTVDIVWRIEDRDGTPMLAIDWRERGGPPVVAPVRQGFGSKLIRLGLTGTGGVDLRYHATGFEAEMRAPLHQLLDA